MKKLLLTLSLFAAMPVMAMEGDQVFETPQVQVKSVQQIVNDFLNNPGERTLNDLKSSVRALHTDATDADIQTAIASFYKIKFADSTQELAQAAADALNAFDAQKTLKDLEREINVGLEKLKEKAAELAASKEAQKASTVVTDNLRTATHGLEKFAQTGKLRIRFGHKKKGK